MTRKPFDKTSQLLLDKLTIDQLDAYLYQLLSEDLLPLYRQKSQMGHIRRVMRLDHYLSQKQLNIFELNTWNIITHAERDNIRNSIIHYRR